MDKNFEDVRKRTWLIVFICLMAVFLIMTLGNPLSSRLASTSPLHGDSLLEFHDLNISISDLANVVESDEEIVLHPISDQSFPEFLIRKVDLQKRVDLQNPEALEELVLQSTGELPYPGTTVVDDPETLDLSGHPYARIGWELRMNRKEVAEFSEKKGEDLESNKFSGSTYLIPWKKQAYLMHFITYSHDRANYRIDDLVTDITIDGQEDFHIDTHAASLDKD